MTASTVVDRIEDTLPLPLTRRRGAGLAICALLVVVLTAMSLWLGARPVPLEEVIGAIFSFDGSTDQMVIRELRIPRTALGLIVGAALGAAGALMQAISRNPLADPGLLGISSGASFAVVIGITFLGLGSATQYVWLAFVGAALTWLAVYTLGRGRTGITPVRMVLAGAALAALLGSFTSAILIFDLDTLDAFRFWVIGSLAGRPINVFIQMAPFLAIGLLIAVTLGGSLNAISLGDESARSLGVKIGWTRFATVIAITLLCGAATAACGPIGFIGLVIPHVARLFSGPDHRWLIPYSALLGAVMLMACDILSRLVARPGEIQAGITTAFVGGLFFVLLIRRTRMAQL